MEASYQSCIFCISSRWLKILHFQMSVSASSNGLEYFEESLFWYSSKEFFAKMFFFDFILACINIKQIWNASKFFIRIQMYCSARLKLVRCDGFYGRGVGFTRSCRADPAFSIRLYSRHFFCLFWSGIFDGFIRVIFLSFLVRHFWGLYLFFFFLSSFHAHSFYGQWLTHLYTLLQQTKHVVEGILHSLDTAIAFSTNFCVIFVFVFGTLLWLFLSSIITQNWNSVLLLWCPLCFQCLNLSHFQMLFHSDSLVPSYYGDGFVRWGKSWRQEEAGFTRSVWPIWNALEPDRSLCFKGFMLQYFKSSYS